MKMLRNVFYLGVSCLWCCKKPFNPPVVSSPSSYLVVEGAINPGNDSTFIKLSKTVKLSAGTANNPVLGATITVEDEQQNKYALTDLYNNGNYSSGPLNLPLLKKYRLNIILKSGQQYASDFEQATNTPLIDSVTYNVQNNNLNLFVNAHDAAAQTHYYRWEYEETYIFHSNYLSDYVLDPNSNSIVRRPDSKKIYSCFGNDKSSTIVLFSTAKLDQDVVYEAPLTQIPITSEKLEEKYSILVKQYALSPQAYSFYQNIKKNSENLGSIFDAQPSQLNGNIHNLKDPSEPVIGFVTVSAVQTKRIFISSSVLPKGTRAIYPYNCDRDTALYYGNGGVNEVQNALINPPLTGIPSEAIFFGSQIIGYTYSTPICIDCKLRGTQVVPSFWQ